MATLYCLCCGRRYTQLESAELLADAQGRVERQRLVDSHLGPYARNRLRDAGYETVADVARAGDSLLEVNGIGPATLEQIGEALEADWGRALDEVGATPLEPGRSATQ